MTTQQLEAITRALENRIATLELELTQIKHLIQPAPPAWSSVLSSFADCPEFDRMAKLGASWRAEQNVAPDLD
jgi:hypothetical protein